MLRLVVDLLALAVGDRFFTHLVLLYADMVTRLLGFHRLEAPTDVLK